MEEQAGVSDEQHEFPEEDLRTRALAAEEDKDFDALFSVAGELYHLVSELRQEAAALRADIEALEEEDQTVLVQKLPCAGCRDAEDLARAVANFAEWQFQGYEGWQEDARQDVGRQLWYEVSDLVRRATGDTPTSPSFGPARHGTT